MATIESKLEGLKVDERPEGQTDQAVQVGEAERAGQTAETQEAVEAEKGEGSRKYGRGENPKLRYKKPYWWPYRTFVKKR